MVIAVVNAHAVKNSKTKVAHALSNWEEVAIRRLKPKYEAFADRLTLVRKRVNVTKLLASVVSVSCTAVTVAELCTDYVELDLVQSLLIAAIGFIAGALAGGASLIEQSVATRGLHHVSQDERALGQLDHTLDTFIKRSRRHRRVADTTFASYTPFSMEQSDTTTVKKLSGPVSRILLAFLNCSDDLLRCVACVLPSKLAFLFVILALVDLWTIVECSTELSSGTQVTLADKLLERCSHFELKHATVSGLLDSSDQQLGEAY